MIIVLSKLKNLHAAAQIAQEGANEEIEEYLSKFSFPTEESKKLTKGSIIKLLWSCNLNALQTFSF